MNKEIRATAKQYANPSPQHPDRDRHLPPARQMSRGWAEIEWKVIPRAGDENASVRFEQRRQVVHRLLWIAQVLPSKCREDNIVLVRDAPDVRDKHRVCLRGQVGLIRRRYVLRVKLDPCS